MSRYFITVIILIVTLLFGFGCEQNQKSEPTPILIDEPKPAVEPNVQDIPTPEPQQPAETNLIEPKKAEEIQKTPGDELYTKCSEFLNKYVNRQGMIDYRVLSRKKLELADILESFKTLDRNIYNSWTKEDKIAFWINGYNLEFIKIILDNYPIESTRVLRLFWPPNSIMHIKGVRDQHKFIIMGEEFTLNEIEERYFKKEFDEPKLVFGIFYASVSGVPLRNEAYRGDTLDAQLNDQAKRFLADSDSFRINRSEQVVYLSPILQSSWFGQIFVAKYGTNLKFKQQDTPTQAVLNFLINYLPPQDVNYLETANYTVKYLKYDWTLNDISSQ